MGAGGDSGLDWDGGWGTETFPCLLKAFRESRIRQEMRAALGYLCPSLNLYFYVFHTFHFVVNFFIGI